MSLGEDIPPEGHQADKPVCTLSTLTVSAKIGSRETVILRYLQSHTYGLLTKCEVKMAGYWPTFFACLWTETESRSINSQKKNEDNIQPS